MEIKNELWKEEQTAMEELADEIANEIEEDTDQGKDGVYDMCGIGMVVTLLLIIAGILVFLVFIS